MLLPRGPVGDAPGGLAPVRSRVAGPGPVRQRRARRAARGWTGSLGGGLDVVWAPAPAPLAVSRGRPARAHGPRPLVGGAPAGLHAATSAPGTGSRARAGSPGGRRAVICRRRETGARRPRRRLGPRPPRACTPSRRRRRSARRRRAGAGERPRRAPYLLFVGALEPRKAPDVLAAAHAVARARGLAAELVARGRGAAGPRPGGPGVRRLGPRATTRALSALYARGARARRCRRAWRASGCRRVEALAHGTPVVATDLPVLREVLGDAATLSSRPATPRALAAALLRAGARARPARAAVAAGRGAVAA